MRQQSTTTVNGVVDKIEQTVETVKQHLSRDAMSDFYANCKKQASQTVKNHPAQAVTAAALTGLLLGLWLKRSK